MIMRFCSRPTESYTLKYSKHKFASFLRHFERLPVEDTLPCGGDGYRYIEMMMILSRSTRSARLLFPLGAAPSSHPASRCSAPAPPQSSPCSARAPPHFPPSAVGLSGARRGLATAKRKKAKKKKAVGSGSEEMRPIMRSAHDVCEAAPTGREAATRQ